MTPGWAHGMTQLTSPLRSGWTFDPSWRRGGRDHLDPGAHNLPSYHHWNVAPPKGSGTLPQRCPSPSWCTGTHYLLLCSAALGCHRIDTPQQRCRSPVRCSRWQRGLQCSQDDITCHQALCCSSAGEPHGPGLRLHFQLRAQQLYADLAGEGTPLHAINNAAEGPRTA
ncbi:hypothetical protein GWK47_027287 [Chionoecetes opilio]|uniref:Uncharacterized protein n=1 Tax=Chionoecetes opilio TaxID=41210 RepID=A0A8J8WCL5_CHIOP|nr:hypothetical protein GWK47_027287 [Chionoecetes opilio]